MSMGQGRSRGLPLLCSDTQSIDEDRWPRIVHRLSALLRLKSLVYSIGALHFNTLILRRYHTIIHSHGRFSLSSVRQETYPFYPIQSLSLHPLQPFYKRQPSTAAPLNAIASFLFFCFSLPHPSSSPPRFLLVSLLPPNKPHLIEPTQHNPPPKSQPNTQCLWPIP